MTKPNGEDLNKPLIEVFEALEEDAHQDNLKRLAEEGFKAKAELASAAAEALKVNRGLEKALDDFSERFSSAVMRQDEIIKKMIETVSEFDV
jgi:small-conductance mechanosensitive channel